MTEETENREARSLRSTRRSFLGASALLIAEPALGQPKVSPKKGRAGQEPMPARRGAAHIDGPLYYELIGRSGPVMAFIHPNPMDQSCWLFQMAHLSTWFRCIAIDIPGYGRSPKAREGLTMDDMAQACWDAIDDVYPNEAAILVGSSVGSFITPYMHNQRPALTRALIHAGAGYRPDRDFSSRIQSFRQEGVDFRWRFTFLDFSPAFRETPMAHYFANLFSERNKYADVESIIYQFIALSKPEPKGHFAKISCPNIILTGTEDVFHQMAFALQEQIANCELKVLPGAGHACHMEQPWLFDRLLLEFLAKHGLFPKEQVPA